MMPLLRTEGCEKERMLQIWRPISRRYRVVKAL